MIRKAFYTEDTDHYQLCILGDYNDALRISLVLPEPHVNNKELEVDIVDYITLDQESEEGLRTFLNDRALERAQQPQTERTK
jgi:hypothetical protein